MNDEIRVFTASGELHARQIQSFLEAAGIASELKGEALRHTHGLTIDGLGMVEILVASEDAERARDLLSSADRGMFRLDENEDV